MNHDVVPRVVLAVVLATFFVTSAFMGVRSRKSLAKVVTRRESRLKFGAAGILWLAWISASVAFVVNPAWMGWSALPLPAWLRWTGVAITFPAYVLGGWAILSLVLRDAYSGTVVIKDSHALVTSGPYRWIRHPIYTTYFAWTVSFFLLTANGFIGLVLLALSILLASRVEGEEAMVLERFGDEYRAYMQRTGRFLPRSRR